MSNKNWPADFVTQMNSLLPRECQQFLDSLQLAAPTSIRLNPRKPSDRFADNPKVDWHARGRYLSAKFAFFADPLWHAGAYYVQEASSMLLAWIVQHLDLPPATLALDLCGAPGGKSTLLLDVLSPDSLLISNELIKTRYPVLRENLIKWGHTNHFSSSVSPLVFGQLSSRFDLLLVDAPCSGEGLFRKNPAAAMEWNLDQVRFCSKRQRKILADVLPALAPNGYLIYSTCTFNNQENIENVQWLMDKGALESIPLNYPEAWGIQTIQKKKAIGYQCYPHRTKGEGFFMAVLKKNGESLKPVKQAKSKKDHLKLKKIMASDFDAWIKKPAQFQFFEFPGQQEIWAIPEQHEAVFSMLLERKIPFKTGLHVGKWGKNSLVPSHSLSMTTQLNDHLPRITLDQKRAIAFLKKESISNTTGQQGWCLATFEDLPLGWLKSLPNRMNNYYPKEWRIRKDV